MIPPHTFQRPDGVTVVQFADYHNFIEYAVAQPGKYHWKSDHASLGWFSDRGYTDSLKLSRVGWPDGRRAMQVMSDQLKAQSRSVKPEPVYDVIGEGGIDAGLLMAGDPECFLDWRDGEQIQQSAGPVIKIVVDVAVSGGIGAEMIKTRGAAILALIDTLEASGRRVELEAIFYCRTSRKQLTIPLKAADYPLQPDQVAYALAHPAFMRRFCHLAFGEGAAPYHQKGIDADLYLGPMSGYEHDMLTTFATPEATLAWLRGKLTEYGITVEGAA